MEVDILRICGVGVLCSVICVALGRLVGGVGVAVRLGGLALIFGCAVALLYEICEKVTAIGDGMGGEYVALMIKGLGIVTLGRICADVCRDCGESSVASAVETCVRLTVLILALPTVMKLLQSVELLLSEV